MPEAQDFGYPNRSNSLTMFVIKVGTGARRKRSLELISSRRTILTVIGLLLIGGCSPSQPPEVPENLRGYVTETPITPFSLNPGASAYGANLASYPELPTAKQQDDLIDNLIAFGAIRQLVVRNGGENLDKVIKFKKLEGLHLSFSREATGKSIDLRPLASMKNLKEISVGYEAGVQVGDAEIAVPPSIVYLSLHQLPVRSIPGIENCRDLRELDISFNSRLEDISTLRNLPPLNRLRISASTLTRLSENNIVVKAELLEIVETSSFLKTKADAKEVHVYGTDQLRTLDGIENWQGVSTVHLNYLSGLEDISALAKLKNIRDLVLSQCQLQGKPIAIEDLKAVQQSAQNCKIVVQ